MTSACASSSCSDTHVRPGSENHPCFNPKAAGSNGRVHLPVAPRCNVRCGFCNRKFDCANETRPGVSSKLLKPAQAKFYVDGLRKLDSSLSVVGIAGPGDPLANPEQTLATLALVRDSQPDMTLCLSTNGLALAQHVDALAELGVNHLTVTVNAVDPEIGGQIYRYIRDGGEVLTGEEAGRRLLMRQIAGIKAAVAAGITVKVNTVVLEGVNDFHVPEIAERMAELGAHYHNCIAHIPVEKTIFSHLNEPSPAAIGALRRACAEHLPQMAHCKRCRADAVGRLGDEATFAATKLLQEAAAMTDPETTVTAERPYVAVASREGVFVNVGLGHADKLLIYAEQEDCFELVEVRSSPEPGNGCGRWDAMAWLLDDCRAVVVAEAGATPTVALGAVGLRVLTTEGPIEDALEAVFGDNPGALRPPSCASSGCGGSCGGGAGGGACA